MDCTIGAPCERFAQHLCRTCRPCRADHDLAAMLLAKAERLFERVGVGLVHLVAGVLLTDAPARVVYARLPFPGRDLLDTDSDLQLAARYSCFLNNSAAFVPPNPKEFDSAYSIFTGRHFQGT